MPENELPVVTELRTELHGLKDLRGIAIDPSDPKLINITVATKEDLELVRSFGSLIARRHGYNARPRLLTDTVRQPGGRSIKPLPILLPYICYGFRMSDRAAKSKRPPEVAILPVTEAECRDCTTTLGKLFSDSLRFDTIIAVATGGKSVLDYLIARWSIAQYGHAWPNTAEENRACQARFKLVCGFRSGWGKDAMRLGTEAMAEALQSAGAGNVMVVDTTFKFTGQETLLKVLGDAAPKSSVARILVAPVVDESRRKGEPVPEWKLPTLKFPFHIKLYHTERLIIEDISMAIGFRQVSKKRVVEPCGGTGVIAVNNADDGGMIFEPGTIAAFVSDLIANPRRRLQKRNFRKALPLARLRTILASVTVPGKFKDAVEAVIAPQGKLSTFLKDVRDVRKSVGVIMAKPNPRVQSPLSKKIEDADMKAIEAVLRNRKVK